MPVLPETMCRREGLCQRTQKDAKQHRSDSTYSGKTGHSEGNGLGQQQPPNHLHGPRLEQGGRLLQKDSRSLSPLLCQSPGNRLRQTARSTLVQHWEPCANLLPKLLEEVTVLVDHLLQAARLVVDSRTRIHRPTPSALDSLHRPQFHPVIATGSTVPILIGTRSHVADLQEVHRLSPRAQVLGSTETPQICILPLRPSTGNRGCNPQSPPPSYARTPPDARRSRNPPR